MRKIILTLLGIFLVGCVIWFLMFNYVGYLQSNFIAGNNNKKIVNIKIGTSRDELLHVMGSPERMEAYRSGNKVMEIYFYRTKGFAFYFQDSDANLIPISVDNETGMIFSMDRNFYSQVIKASKKKSN